MSKTLQLHAMDYDSEVNVSLEDVGEIIFTGDWAREYNNMLGRVRDGLTQVTRIRFNFSSFMGSNWGLRNAVYALFASAKSTVEIFDFSKIHVPYMVQFSPAHMDNYYEQFYSDIERKIPRNPLSYIIPHACEREMECELVLIQEPTRVKHVMLAILSARVGEFSALKKLPSELCRVLAGFLTIN